MPQISWVCCPQHTPKTGRWQSPSWGGQQVLSTHQAVHNSLWCLTSDGHEGALVLLLVLQNAVVTPKSHHPGHVRTLEVGSRPGLEVDRRERPHPSAGAWHSSAPAWGSATSSCRGCRSSWDFGMEEHGLDSLEMAPGRDIPGGCGAAIHPSREHGCVSGAKGLVDEHPRLASNGNQRKGEKTFKASSLPARSRRSRAHACTHNVLQNF